MANYDANLLGKFRPRQSEAVARMLRDSIDQQHAARVSKTLGCTVTILRREYVRAASGQFLLSEPVFAVPVAFLEQAQILGLRAEAR